MKRAIVVVLDGCGAGEAPDSAEFGDAGASTLRHVWEASAGFSAPMLAGCGYLAAAGIAQPVGIEGFGVRWGRLVPRSKGGKDSVTGHWEMMGIVTDEPFPTYPEGFPNSLVSAFEQTIGREALGNRPASGTAIIAELGAQHMASGKPILYTSADSVFQLACHEEIVPIATLYRWCEVARALCVDKNAVQRVIARPFIGSSSEGFTRTGNRRDYPLPPASNLIDSIGEVQGIGVVPELFAHRGFRKGKRTQSNPEHAVALRAALESDARFVFANFEDFDMLYGHRNDPIGFAKCLEAFDSTLQEVLGSLRDDDLLILTADHGNDPTDSSTDHSRECVPVSIIGKCISGGALGDVVGMNAIGATVATWLGVVWPQEQNLLDFA